MTLSLERHAELGQLLLQVVEDGINSDLELDELISAAEHCVNGEDNLEDLVLDKVLAFSKIRDALGKYHQSEDLATPDQVAEKAVVMIHRCRILMQGSHTQALGRIANALFQRGGPATYLETPDRIANEAIKLIEFGQCIQQEDSEIVAWAYTPEFPDNGFHPRTVIAPTRLTCFDGWIEIKLIMAPEVLVLPVKAVAWAYYHDGMNTGHGNPIVTVRRWSSVAEPWTEVPLRAVVG